ncbi:carbohydrate ABC transporter permease [Treponema brennaborense]|uniref:ABC-type transporter, integral membrane subunit n=1 Tax=Treponema brennaborense (strain DSM 12168 / CIP 105900 / DD5/3) TaxID=906968 RepID=F4LL98_TREBD|nr:carbohydrate ABC transporter permease [Treponema brennaborense]AEE15576.1 ABC-type transporter, integral membrane subunit [Treponema brennaborense DSM 12168]
MRTGRIHSRVVMYAFLTVVCLASVFPFYWMLVAATNYSVDVIKGSNFFGTALIDNVKTLTATVNLGGAFWNSLRNTVAGTAASLFVCSLAGYGFQVYRDKNKDMLMKILLLSIMVPFASIMVPLFRLFSQVKMLDTTMGFILPSVSTAFLIFFFRQNSMSFPIETVQAARVDGLSEFGIYLKIYLPVMMPSFVAAGIVTFMNNWNSYLWPLIIMQTQRSQTMPLLIAGMTAGYTTDYGALMLAVTVCTLPTVILFFTQQKRFVSGILGSVK